MQQRRLRLGDIVDDYCPRERRITNHAIVAMIEDEVKQTRCTTCDADHEYKQARIPAQRRKKDAAPSLVGDNVAAPPRKRDQDAAALDEETATDIVAEAEPSLDASEPEPVATGDVVTGEAVTPVTAEAAAEPVEPQEQEPTDPADAQPVEDDGPVHRRLIRATLPRVEGQTPERKAPEFTIHQREANGNRPGRGPRRGPRPGQRNTHHGGGQTSRFGGPRQGQGQSPRHGSGHGHGQGSQGQQRQPGNRSGQGGQHGPRNNRPGGGGRKRGR